MEKDSQCWTPKTPRIYKGTQKNKCTRDFWMVNVINFVTWTDGLQHDFETTPMKNLKCGKFGKLTNTYLQNKSWCPQDKMWYISSSSSSSRSKSFVTFKWNWVKSWICWRWSSTIGFNTFKQIFVSLKCKDVFVCTLTSFNGSAWKLCMNEKS